MKVCVVVPMFNEEGIVKQSVETILGYTQKLPPEVKVLVVNDGSFDKTAAVLEDIKTRYSKNAFEVISHKKNMGYGGAIRTGIAFAVAGGYDYALFMDSDLTNDPRYLKDFYTKMLEGCDYIKATRYSKGGGTKGVPFRPKLISVLGNMFARICYGLPLADITNGFRAAKTEILKPMDLKESGFAIIMEELLQAKYLARSFCEVPYVLTSRSAEAGKTHFSYSYRIYMKYLKYALMNFHARR